MRTRSSFATLVLCLIGAAGAGLGYALYAATGSQGGAVAVVVGGFVVASLVASAIKVAAPWDRAVVLRLGRFRALRGPGLFGIIPIVDTIAVLDRHPRDHDRRSRPRRR